jgi:hypothetical protein
LHQAARLNPELTPQVEELFRRGKFGQQPADSRP